MRYSCAGGVCCFLHARLLLFSLFRILYWAARFAFFARREKGEPLFRAFSRDGFRKKAFLGIIIYKTEEFLKKMRGSDCFFGAFPPSLWKKRGRSVRRANGGEGEFL